MSSNSLLSLRDHFLISMPHLDDDAFTGSLVYICDHSEYGAMGLVLNQPLNINLDVLLNNLDIPSQGNGGSIPVYSGGPVQEERGFVLHKKSLGDSWLSTHEVTDDICLTTSLDILEAVDKVVSDDIIITLGHAGWGPNQLEKEMSDNVWLSCPANSDIMFNIPAEDRLHAAAAMLGVNLNLMTSHAGHA